MTTVYTNTFTGTNGTAPADFVTSEVGGTGGTRDIQSNALRLLTTATNFNTQRLILPSGNWNQADGEVAITATTQTGVGQLLLELRASGTWDATENDLATTCYAALINMPGNVVAFYKNVAGTVTQIGTDQAFTFADTTTYGIRFKVAGTTLSLKVWTGTEPGPYTYTQTDSSVTAAGQFQVAFRTVSTAVRDVRLDTLTLDDLATVVSPTLNANGVFAYATDPTPTSGELVFDFIAGSVGLAIDGVGIPTITGTVAKTLANATSAAAGATGAGGTLARTLANATSVASGTAGAPTTGTLARTLANAAVVAAGATGPSGTLAKTLADLTSSASGTQNVTTVAATLNSNGIYAYATDPAASGGLLGFDFVAGQVSLLLESAATVAPNAGSVAVTLGALQSGAPLLDQNSLPIFDQNNQPIVTAATFGAHGIGATLAKTLANVTSVASGSTVSGTVARTLQNLLIAASGGSSNSSTLAKTLDPVVLQGVGKVGAGGSLSEVLDDVALSATGATGGVFGTVARTLDAVATASALTDDLGDPILDDNSLPLLVQGAEGAHAVGGIVARTLANITSVATGVATATVTGTVAKSLADVTAVAAGGSGVAGTTARTLGNVTSTTVTGTVGVTGSAAVTLANATSAADGTSTPGQVAGNASVTLANVTVAADGSTVGGELAETLDDATMAAAGTAGPVPVTGTLTVTLADVVSVAAGFPTVIGTVARTLDDVVGDAIGSSVSGTLAVTLDDVTSVSSATVTVTVFAIGHIEAIYKIGAIDSIFETGRILAVAGSRR